MRLLGMDTRTPPRAAMRTIFAVSLTMALAAIPAAAQRGGGLRSLKTVAVPQPTNLSTYVRDSASLIALGKAFFWDSQVGSDGRTACATCHFHAGADHRQQNQLSTGPGVSGTVIPNQPLAASRFPFHQLSNVTNNRSAVVSDARLVAGSAGVNRRTFYDIVLGSAFEDGSDVSSEAASINGVNARQVTNRNAPTVINAVFNVRNFWDGRARSTFTGSTPFGTSDPNLNALAYRNGQILKEAVAMANASLASQAVGPPVGSSEMTYDGRTWPKIGRKLMSLAPLARQTVAADDSVLGALANANGTGLLPQYSYVAMIQAAFQPEYWSAPAGTDTGSEFNQMETNFSLFWGLAIQAYESTLVSDNTRVDQFLEGNTGALTAVEQQGLNAFRDGGSQCTNCHQGAEFTAAAFSTVSGQNNQSIPGNAGFFRTGVTPISDDLGGGVLDGFGLPLFGSNTAASSGVFKSPGLRNVELTGPYFHDGGQATLEQVLLFYARNGDFPAGGNLGPGIGRINMSAAEQTQIVAFLKALSDDRVKFERAPFDHPSLCVPVGNVESSPGVLALDNSDPRFVLSALDKFALIPASGRSGNGVPLQTFAELLLGIGSDGSRAHALTDSCVP